MNRVRPSMTPSAKPVMMEPMIDPMPPMTTTANTTTISSAPMRGRTWFMGADRTPANPARATPKP